jgi:hypothetical protein
MIMARRQISGGSWHIETRCQALICCRIIPLEGGVPATDEVSFMHPVEYPQEICIEAASVRDFRSNTWRPKCVKSTAEISSE